MGLQVIGSGLGRTGTHSLKLAIEQLGLGPCHHMVEVLAHPETTAGWVEAFDGRPDWEALFAGYNSAVDAPACRFWRELADYYPHAKVIHTTRDPDAWFESTQAAMFAPGTRTMAPEPALAAFFERNLRIYQGRQNDRGFMIDQFQRHNAEVLATIPGERLLVHQASQGWEPLCAFLGAPVPATPYPLTNTREDFAAREAQRRAGRDPFAS